MPELTVISLGWGVQSTTLAVMSALGDLPPVDFAIHADTTHERAATYAYAAQWGPWLTARGVKVITVVDPSTSDLGNPKGPDRDGRFIPAYTLAPRGFSATAYAASGDAGGLDSAELTEGQLRRQCTNRWKIVPMRHVIAAALETRGLPKTPGLVEQWIGISQDEFQRMRPSDVKYIAHRYPLIERKMTRADCIAYLQAHDIDVPGKSACVFCPYHRAGAWQELKRAGGPDWAHALAIDTLIRDMSPPFPIFVHRARVPLEQAVTIPEDQGLVQGGLFDPPEVADAPCDNGGCFI